MSNSRANLLQRIGSAFRSAPVITQKDREPVSLLQESTIQTKDSLGLLPRGIYGSAYDFFSPNGGRTFIEGEALHGTSLAFAAYWHVATRWRAQKIAEAPLMVVEEDQQSGDEEWLPDHELAIVFESPSDDYDMGELISRTSLSLDNTGACLWIMDRDRIGRIVHITPFRRPEFVVHSSSQRLYQTFTVQTSDGPVDFDASEVCYFRDFADDSWLYDHRSRLDVAMNWLRLGESSRQTIRDLLGNAVWPSAVVIPDKDWNPDPKTLELYKQDLEKYAKPGQRGRPFVQLGGGSFETLSASIKDLVPTDVLNRVESVISAVSGVPAIVLQFQIGMENSPWSQMEEARKMAYADTVVPAWRKFERTITRQMLRSIDDDPTHLVRFDESKIDSLQRNMIESTTIATAMGKQATLNERRAVMGLEPATAKQDPDKKADTIPELTQPSITDILAAQGGVANNPKDPNAPPIPPANDPAKDPTLDPEAEPKKTALLALIERKIKPVALTQMLRNESSDAWEVTAHALLQHDRDTITDIVKTLLVDSTHKSVESKTRGSDRVTRAIEDYFQQEGKTRWTKAMTPLMVQGAERSIAVQAADLGVNYAVLQGKAIQFAQQNAAQMITEVSKTTKRLIHDIVTGGLEENRSTTEIAQLIQDATGFDKARAKLIARTETTTIFSGAPVEALTAFGKSTGRSFLKTWFGVMDDKERDAHVELEGETVGIDEPFSNGLLYPSEPNCRCHILTHEEET